MPTAWHTICSQMPQLSSIVVLDSLENRIFAIFEQTYWLLQISPTNKPIRCDLDYFPLWRYPTDQELSDFKYLKLHNEGGLKMHSEELELAQIAYNAYGQTTDFKNYQGLPMPKWENLSDRIQQAWIAAASTVARVVIKKSTESLAKTIVDDVVETLYKEE